MYHTLVRTIIVLPLLLKNCLRIISELLHLIASIRLPPTGMGSLPMGGLHSRFRRSCQISPHHTNADDNDSTKDRHRKDFIVLIWEKFFARLHHGLGVDFNQQHNDHQPLRGRSTTARVDCRGSESLANEEKTHEFHRPTNPTRTPSHTHREHSESYHQHRNGGSSSTSELRTTFCNSSTDSSISTNDSTHLQRQSPVTIDPTLVSLPRDRSRSPALPCTRPNKKQSIYASNDVLDPKDEEITIANAEIMYAKATWRMYERITNARKAQLMARQHGIQRFHIPSVPVSNVNTSYPRIESPNQMENFHPASVDDDAFFEMDH